MQCKNCGRDVKSDFKYCPYCANRLINDFEDHYGELNPPYVMPDMSDQEPDASAFLYGRARVIPDEADTFFAPEKAAVSEENADMQSTTSEEVNRPLPYEIYRPESGDHVSGLHLPEKDFTSETKLHRPLQEAFHTDLPDDFSVDFPDLPDEEGTSESELHHPLHENFHVNLPEDLPDDFADLPDLPDETGTSEPDLRHPPREVFRAHLPDDLEDDLPDLPDEDFVSEPEDYQAPHDQAPYEQPPMQELKWETRLSDAAPEVQSNKTLEDAPYVVMQPDVEEQAARPRVAVQNSGPSVAIKLLLILFMVLLGVLASFLLYRFFGDFINPNRLDVVSSAAASCWQQAWRGHYFL